MSLAKGGAGSRRLPASSVIGKLGIGEVQLFDVERGFPRSSSPRTRAGCGPLPPFDARNVAPPRQERPAPGSRSRPSPSRRPSPGIVTDRARDGLEPRAVQGVGETTSVSQRGRSASRFPCLYPPLGVHPLSFLNDLSRPFNGSNPRSFVLVAMPIAFAVGWYGAAAKHRWRQRR